MCWLVSLTFLLALSCLVRSETPEAECGGIISSELGELQSPGFPGKYPNSKTCTWKIISPNQDEKIRISFNRFNIEEGVPMCQYDHLIIRDGATGAAPLLGKFCGDNLPQNLWSTTNKIWIQFVSDSKNTYTGFKLKYVSLPSERFPSLNTPEPTKLPDVTCGKFLEENNGTITSPGYPDNYYPEKFCRWIIDAQTPNEIELTINFIDIEYQVSCDYDYLRILDSMSPSSRQLLKACGKHTNLTFHGKQFVIEFRSDKLRSRRGFKISWRMRKQRNSAIDKMIDSTACRHKETGFLGSITSAAYPENYNNSLSCEWVIKSEESTKIQLRITDFKLEHSHTCKYDFLEVYDGLSRNAPLLGRYCGEKYPDILSSSSNKMYLYFQTDKTDTYRGFEATWLALYQYSNAEGKLPKRRKLHKRSKLSRRQVDNDKCGQVFTSETGVLTSPKYPSNYPSNSACDWTIKSDPFHQIVLTFEDFEMELHSECRYDYLMIRDGVQKDARVIGKYCGRNSPNIVRAKTDAIRLELISDSTTERKGFKANWRWEKKESVTPSDCGGKLDGENGVITSPNYPNSGKNPYICVWSIVIPKGGRVKFEFTDMDITSHPGCGKGYVQLNDGKTRFDPNLGVFCGDTLPRPIITSANSLCIGFLSDGSGSMKGFKARWTTIYSAITKTPAPKARDTPCDEVFFEQTGQIFRSTGFTNCSWTIKVPSNKHIIISFGDVNMLDDGDCRREQVEIRDGVYSGAPLLMRTCGQLKPSAVRSSTNEVTVKHSVIKSIATTLVNIYWKTIEVDKRSDVFDAVTCGLSNVPVTSSNGDKGALPWTIGIMGLFNRAHCGGAILSPDWIITAAHCFERLPWTMLWTIRAGEYDMMKNEGTEQNRKIRKIIIHPQYNAITYDNDIALLRLDRPLTLTNKVKSVCLPHADMKVPDGKICSIAGWGTNRYLSRRPSGPLEHILPEIISKDTCNKAYDGKVTDNMICAGGNGLDSCQGDGGSALSCVDDSGKYYVVGLSSWGNGCAFPGKHGVYSDVRRKIAWIRETVIDYGRKK